MESKYDDYYMLQALQLAMFSYAPDKKAGCVITKDDRPISNGYNGTLPLANNTMVDEQGCTLDNVIHAEVNAIHFCRDNDINTTGATMYITLSPCIDCAKLIVFYNIKRVVYYETWKNTEGLDYLRTNNIEVEKWEKSNV